MHLPRKLTVLLALALLPLGVSACAGEAEDETLDEELGEPAATPAPATPAATDMQPMTAQFTALNNSGVAGSIEVDDEGEQTKVKVTLTGSQANAVHQGHIHAGTCDAPGAVVIPLQPVTIGDDGSGEVESTVAVAPATAFNGQHIVLYHEAGGAPGAPIACAAIPQHAM
jgi:hypothetical protein